MNARIRPANQADCETLVGLMSAFYREDGDPFDATASRAAFAALLADPRWGRVWLAEDAVDAIGYLALTFGFSMEFGGRDALIDDFYVVPARRGKGIGTALLIECERACHELGLHALHLEVRPANPAAALYARVGFRDRNYRLMTKPLDHHS